MTRDSGDLAVIFDIGRVLVDVDETAGLYGWLQAQGAVDAEAWFDRVARPPVLRDFGLGKVTGLEVHAELCRATGLELAYHRFERLWAEVLQPLPYGERLFRSVASRRTVGILSNTNALHWRDLRVRFPWLRIPRCPTLSFEVGRLKPDPEIYRIAAADVGHPPERCLFIDDLAANVAGAHEAGMQSVRFTTLGPLVEELTRLQVLPAGWRADS